MRFAIVLLLLLIFAARSVTAEDAVTLREVPDASADDIDRQFDGVRALLKTYCFECHSSETKEGELDLERFHSVTRVRQDIKPWMAMIQQLETREMPPKDQPQPSDTQRKELLDWVQRLLAAEARAKAGDPGAVPLHRLSNTEYNNSVRDLTGVDLLPAREFPADGAAGEGFTNAAAGLAMSPAMMTKYVAAAKEIADHAVLLPTGFRFSTSTTQRDWTDESLSAIREFYRPFTTDGRLPLKPYLVALLRHRNDLIAGKVTLEDIAIDQNLSPKYLRLLWEALQSESPKFPLDRVCAIWKGSNENDADAIVREVTALSDPLWESRNIGSYRSEHRQVPRSPSVQPLTSISLPFQPVPGEEDVTLYFVTRELTRPIGGMPAARITFQHPRFTGTDLPPLSLRDYSQYGSQYEVDYTTLFDKTEAYLAASIQLANDESLTVPQLAEQQQLDATWLQRWVTVLDVTPLGTVVADKLPGRTVPPIKMPLLKSPAPNAERASIRGWKPESGDLPVVVSNSSDKIEQVPGRVSPHGVSVHPMPKEFVAVVWTSPIAGVVKVSGKVVDAHATCGNGVMWWVEMQTPDRAAILTEGTVDLGKSADISPQVLKVAVGDRLLLAIDARESNHFCDLTEVTFSIAETTETKARSWDLARDVADTIGDGNPHADRLGNTAVWSFETGPSAARPLGAKADDDVNSLLNRWRIAAATVDKKDEAKALGKELRELFTGKRPAADRPADRKLYDRYVIANGPLLKGIDLSSLSKSASSDRYGLPAERFRVDADNGDSHGRDVELSSGEVLSVRLPAAMFHERQFVVDILLSDDFKDRAVQVQVLTSPPGETIVWGAADPIIAATGGAGERHLRDGWSEFRRLFPPSICYPHIIPVDEVVCLKTFHREDEALRDLFLDDAQQQELERLWSEHRFISKFPIVENEYLPLFIGFVTQDQPQSLVDFFEAKRPYFEQRAVAFSHDFEQAAPQQLQQLIDFSARAYRRPLSPAEVTGLNSLYDQLRARNVPHEAAFRSLLSRVLISPSFLLHIEQAPSGTSAQPVNDWELASRLSYFLWSSLPDDELRTLAAAGRLHEPDVLAQQTGRLLQDPRSRSLAIEFGTQMIHVRGFDQFAEKNEQLFPSFDKSLRSAMQEEAILLFQHLFQQNRPAIEMLTADYTFLNRQLAEHYGIEGVTGDEWQRVNGVHHYGRGGILGFACVQSKQAGSSRTSPVLRGNWVVETLLGEKLPRPPLNVPQLPESEIGNDGLTMREIVARHVSDAQCAHCHERIDPFGLALEEFDPIGRRRKHDLGSLPIDTSVTLRDGTQFSGINGLREYLLTHKQQTINRMFYKRLVGYALSRQTTLSDQLLIEQMIESTKNKDYGLTDAIIAIVQSPQFRNIRGADYHEN
ncbi:MAG: DUF1592 domain-containing protein [Planctomycetaceae bacterium]